MKKILVVVCTITLLGLAACNKDKDNDNGQNTEQPTNQGDGIYNPGAKIDQIHYSDSATPDEVWQWEGDRVMSISMTAAGGSEQAGISFDYNNEGRIADIFTTVMGAPIEAALNYNAQKLINGASIYAGGTTMATAQVSHNAQQKVNRISLDVNDEVLAQLVQLISMLLSDSNSIMPFLTTTPSSKFSIDNDAFEANFIWGGNNVTRMIVNAQLNMTTTLNEIPTGLLQTLVPADYASMIELAVTLMGDTPIPVQVTVTDTVDYTYDNQQNPLRGFLGRMSIAALSANNLATVTGHGKANISGSLNLGLMGSLPINYDYPLNDLGNASYSYTYTPDGYPLVVTDADGNTTEYVYKEQ